MNKRYVTGHTQAIFLRREYLFKATLKCGVWPEYSHSRTNHTRHTRLFRASQNGRAKFVPKRVEILKISKVDGIGLTAPVRLRKRRAEQYCGHPPMNRQKIVHLNRLCEPTRHGFNFLRVIKMADHLAVRWGVPQYCSAQYLHDQGANRAAEKIL